MVLTGPNWLGGIQAKEKKHPTPAFSSYPVPPKGEEKPKQN